MLDKIESFLEVLIRSFSISLVKIFSSLDSEALAAFLFSSYNKTLQSTEAAI